MAKIIGGTFAFLVMPLLALGVGLGFGLSGKLGRCHPCWLCTGAIASNVLDSLER